jgi:hypothetical protein
LVQGRFVMARSISVNQSGTYKEVVQAYVRDGGVWKSPTEIYVNQSGTWKQVYPAESGSQTYTTPGSYNFTVPSGITSVTVSVYGAGGGGGSGWFCGDAWTGGSGGTGGYQTNQTLAVTPGEILSVTVGAAGAGGVYPGICGGSNPGSNGGTSSVVGASGSYTATGGNGGPGGINGGNDGAGGSPNGVSGSGLNTPGCPTITGPTNGTGYGSGGFSQCAGVGGNGTDGAVAISWG